MDKSDIEEALSQVFGVLEEKLRMLSGQPGFKIPPRKEGEKSPAVKVYKPPENKKADEEGIFYELEYDTVSIPGVGRFVSKSQPVKEPPRDEIRELFSQMRDIARERRREFQFSHGYHMHLSRDEAMIFYQQGMLMKDFTDNYPDIVPFSEYFPRYQMMGYEQLRTYFTWRTRIRQGTVKRAAVSYAFLYIYELLSNIGVDSPQEGLNRLIFFWHSYRKYNNTIDRYLTRWVRDYYIYYGLEGSFYRFITENGIDRFYPEVNGEEGDFGIFCSAAKYDLRKSAFFTPEHASMIVECLDAVLTAVEQTAAKEGLSLKKAFFQRPPKSVAWIPFQQALFYSPRKQLGRCVILSKNEIFTCRNGSWSFSNTLTTEDGKQLMGYIAKQMEATLRKLTGHKRKLAADLHLVEHPLVSQLKQKGLSLEDMINRAVADFYREKTKTVVAVDANALSRIRQQALSTQEKLTVADEPEPVTPLPIMVPPPVQGEKAGDFAVLFTPIEAQVLALLLTGGDITAFARSNGLMTEVLMDGINQKAMDLLGDSLTDDDFMLYEDYRDQVKEWIK